MSESSPDRRQLLKMLSGLGSLGGLAAALSLPVACAADPIEERTRQALASVPRGGRLRVLDGENPVELRRGEDGEVSGRSLWCTHYGCEVVWSPDQDAYLCPCHEGVFDAEGQPVSGPPVRALADVPIEVRDGEIIVGAWPSEEAATGREPSGTVPGEGAA